MPAVNKKFTIVRLLCAFGIAIALSVAVIFAVSEEPVTAIYNLFLGPLQSKRHFFEVFASSVPLIFTGLALGLVFKSGNFSMIADACLYTGAVVTAALAIKTSLPFAVHPIVIMIAAAAVGGVIGSIPALLKVYFHFPDVQLCILLSRDLQCDKIPGRPRGGNLCIKEISGDGSTRKADPGDKFPCWMPDRDRGRDRLIHSCIQDEIRI